jgi:hypothetical protein
MGVTLWWLPGLLVMSALFGVPQWLIVRRQLKRNRAWIPITMVGLFAGYGIGTAVATILLLGIGIVPFDMYFDTAAPVGLAIVSLTTGLTIGSCQWFVLRGQVEHAWLWIPANVAGALLVIPVWVWTFGGSAPLAVDLVPGWALWRAGLIAGALYGTATGAALARLLQFPRTDAIPQLR